MHRRVFLGLALCWSLLTSSFFSLSHSSSVCVAAEAYRLGPGDLLAVIVHGVVGKFGRAPVHFPKSGEDFAPAMGFPYSISADGQLHLPLVVPIDVSGLTVSEAQRVVSAAYVAADVQPRPNMVALTLMRKRHVHVTVVHRDPYRGRAAIEKVKLPADQATLLAAIAEGGAFDPHATVRVHVPGGVRATTGHTSGNSGGLSEGSIVELRSPPRHYYFTGGLIAGGEFALPVLGGLNPLQAIAAAGGYSQRGLLPPHHLTILRRSAPTVAMPLSHVLTHPENLRVRPGDTLIVH